MKNNNQKPERPFWQSKPLKDMDRQEWESLCDGCGKCCLHKLEDEHSGEHVYTRVACRYLDTESCRCQHYSDRQQRVASCIVLKPDDTKAFQWLPSSCAYRLVAEGKTLPPWHHLVSESQESVHEAEMSVRARVLSEAYVHPDGLEEHIIQWVE